MFFIFRSFSGFFSDDHTGLGCRSSRHHLLSDQQMEQNFKPLRTLMGDRRWSLKGTQDQRFWVCLSNKTTKTNKHTKTHQNLILVTCATWSETVTMVTTLTNHSSSSSELCQ